ncbi:uncharacterized protein LOC143265783 [Megachile rotundata]|uniref:uncharacterized protein LOC143265783 n=1 Tax=Megachile rotundata TaxID=143995 RepID=UPI003FD1922C
MNLLQFASSILILTLETINTLEVKEIGNNNIISENLGTCKLYYDSIKLNFIIDPRKHFDTVNVIQNEINRLENFCNTQKECTLNKHTLANLRHRIYKIRKINNLTKVALHYRFKRGLLNILGSVSKTLFGTLDENDLQLINQNIDKLFDSQNNLTQVIAKQNMIIKGLTENESLNTIVENMNKNAEILYRNKNQIAFNTHVILLESLLEDMTLETKTMYNGIMLGKKGIIDTTLLNITQFIESYNKIIDANLIHTEIKGTLDNFQLLIDISTLTLVIHDHKIIYQIEIPILENNEWKIVKYHSIPVKQNQVFTAKLLTYSLVLINQEQFMVIDNEYLSQNCRNTPLEQICKRTQPIHINNPENCKEKCTVAVFKIETIAFIPLQGQNQYIAIPRQETTIDALCKTNNRIVIKGPSILSSREDCTLFYGTEIMKIGGTAKEVNITLSQQNSTTNIDLSDIALYEQHVPSIPKITRNLNEYRTDLNHLKNTLSALRIQHRIHTTAAIAYNILTILGWVALGAITLYTLNKIGIFSICTALIPKPLCFKICCNEVQVNNSNNPEISTDHNESSTETHPPSNNEARQKNFELTPLRQYRKKKVGFSQP